MEYPNVVFVKFPEIDEVDEALVSSALNHFFKKVGSDASLQLSVKDYNKGGAKAQHEVKAKVLIGGKSFFADSTDWQLIKTIQQTLKKLETEVSKAMEMKK